MPKIRKYISCQYDDEENEEILRSFIPDYDNAEHIDDPLIFLNKKAVCFEISTDWNGDDSFYWRGGLYARLPGNMRAASFDEADAAIIVHNYTVKRGLVGYYYYSPYGNTYTEYVNQTELILLDRKSGGIYRAYAEDSDAKILVQLTELLAPEPAGSNDEASAAYEVSDTIFFGAYEQDDNTADGAEPLEWLILDKQDGKLLLLSQYGLEYMPYNAENAAATWETCTLRPWMNETFLNEAFSEAEREMIIPSDADQVFLLSKEDVLRYLPTRFARICTSPISEKNDHLLCKWWLSTVKGRDYAMDINSEGELSDSQMRISNKCAVRPAIWIDLEKCSEYRSGITNNG